MPYLMVSSAFGAAARTALRISFNRLRTLGGKGLPSSAKFLGWGISSFQISELPLAPPATAFTATFGGFRRRMLLLLQGHLGGGCAAVRGGRRGGWQGCRSGGLAYRAGLEHEHTVHEAAAHVGEQVLEHLESLVLVFHQRVALRIGF